MANVEASGMIKQSSFLKSIQKHILRADNPIHTSPRFQADKKHKIFCNY